jgi:hypothetical protein
VDPAAAHAVLVTTSHLCTSAGITYRQADHWVRCGYLRPAHHVNKIDRTAQPANIAAHPGSGFIRHFPLAEVSVAYIMRTLIGEPALSVLRAHIVARGYVEDGQREHMLAPGVTLVLDVPLPAWDTHEPGQP